MTAMPSATAPKPTTSPAPAWLDRDLFPFESRFIDIDGHRLHYVDEGSGPVILFSHGTPEWSFGWRDLIKGLRGQFRCVAPDLLGMGLSDKPLDADYSCQAHAERLTRFITALGLKDIALVANDFGLSIALHYATIFPENVRKISIFNGWMWPVNTDPHYARPARMMRGWLGKWLYKRFNFPVNVIQPAAFGDRKKLTPAIHAHYRQALPNPDARVAAYAFSRQLLDASFFWSQLWLRRGLLSKIPMLIFWGMKDKFVPPYELEKWVKAFPDARVIRFEGAGHFVQEEEAATMVERLREFLV